MRGVLNPLPTRQYKHIMLLPPQYLLPDGGLALALDHENDCRCGRAHAPRGRPTAEPMSEAINRGHDRPAIERIDITNALRAVISRPHRVERVPNAFPRIPEQRRIGF